VIITDRGIGSAGHDGLIFSTDRRCICPSRKERQESADGVGGRGSLVWHWQYGVVACESRMLSGLWRAGHNFIFVRLARGSLYSTLNDGVLDKRVAQ
jgi:hypothetical protein